MKPQESQAIGCKGTYLRHITVTSTMGRGVKNRSDVGPGDWKKIRIRTKRDTAYHLTSPKKAGAHPNGLNIPAEVKTLAEMGCPPTRG